MENIAISDCTKEEMELLKEELYGATMEDDTFLHLLFCEILEE